MWNQLNTGEYEGMLAQTISFQGYNRDWVHGYYVRPLTDKKIGSIVLIPHMPGWDEYCREASRRFAQHGYAVLCPDIYCRIGHGTPSEVAALAREQGGLADACVMGDVQGAVDFLKAQPLSNQKAGVIGMCSGGRHAFLAACSIAGLDGAVDCWGGGVVMAKDQLSDKRPIAPIDLTSDLSCPLLGIFGNDDHSPTSDQVDLHEAKLKECGKEYQFFRYDGCGHGFWYYHTEMYRPKAAMESFEQVLSFFEKTLSL